MRVDALQQRVSAIPRGAADYTTNLYADREELERWSQSAPLQVETATEGTVLLLRADRGFNRVYHVAQSSAALSSALTMLPPGYYVTDLIGKVDPLNKVCVAYAEAGFARHAFLRRMTCTGHANVIDGGNSRSVAELAHPDAALDVAEFLDRLLDPYTDQPPSVAELTNAARDGRLLVVSRGGELAGILMYDRTAQAAHLRFWHVAPAAQGGGVGRALMVGFLARCMHVRRIVLWVVGDNERTLAIYRHYGFATDGLLDYIMTLRKDREA